MGTVNVASWCLLIGAMGQVAFYESLRPGLPAGLLRSLLLLPWLTTYTISFCRRPPFGPRLFRRALAIAMGLYAFATLLAESLHFLLHPAPRGHFSYTLARALMYFGSISFVVFVRA